MTVKGERADTGQRRRKSGAGRCTVCGKTKLKTEGESNYKSYDELPLFLNSDTVAKTLGVAPSSAYELMHEKDFPTLRIGSRMVVPKEKFIQWVEEHTKGGDRT